MSQMDNDKSSDRRVRVPEAAELLGISVSTLRHWIFHRRIEVVRLGRTVAIRESVIRDLVRNGGAK